MPLLVPPFKACGTVMKCTKQWQKSTHRPDALMHGKAIIWPTDAVPVA